jgi:hypothetical protein
VPWAENDLNRRPEAGRQLSGQLQISTFSFLFSAFFVYRDFSMFFRGKSFVFPPVGFSLVELCA